MGSVYTHGDIFSVCLQILGVEICSGSLFLSLPPPLCLSSLPPSLPPSLPHSLPPSITPSLPPSLHYSLTPSQKAEEEERHLLITQKLREELREVADRNRAEVVAMETQHKVSFTCPGSVVLVSMATLHHPIQCNLCTLGTLGTEESVLITEVS